ncbi:MAG: hypothetical protein LLF94_01275 [Chlamydiales bacterium]|nr:hypothetical protein [Chlamydiales bacterium]
MASTLVGEANIIMTREAMEAISAKEVLGWAEAFIGDTIQKKRREFQKATKNNSVHGIQKNGTEIGNIATEELLLRTGSK